jgi:hypothetical protein
MKANWGDNEAAISSSDELRALINDVRNTGQPTMVFLEADDRTVLVFGIGREESVLSFVAPDGTSFHSLGDRDRKGYQMFLCRDQIDEFMNEMAVPEPDAISAAEHFLVTREQPPQVTWEPDW